MELVHLRVPARASDWLFADHHTGLDAPQFESLIRKFYDVHNSKAASDAPAIDPADLLFSDSPPIEQVTIDDELFEVAFEWLCKNPDISIKPRPNTPEETEQLNHHSPSRLETRLAGNVICASEDRIWREVAGHAVDHVRIPAKEFECLLVIAASGASGILQKYVTERTGQDKRSVPKRTDRLAKNGYIVKEAVVGEGAKTSVLTLKKYKEVQAAAPEEQDAVAMQGSGTGPLIFYDAWYDATMAMLKENGNIASLADLRIGLGINKKRWETRRYFHCIRRLTHHGCLRAFRALQERKENLALNTNLPARRVKCVELLREPTESDRLVFRRSDPKNRKPALPDDLDDLGESDEEGDATIADVDLLDNTIGYEDGERSRPVARWRPHLPLNNAIFDVIDSAGPKGFTASQIYQRLCGTLWRRPLDEILAKLTDIWHHSQPPHLRHLTLVRDTSLEGKSAVFHYYTLDNFCAAVDAGQAMWDAVEHDANANPNAPSKRDAISIMPDLDEWGFPRLPAEQFVRDGRASLAECRKGALIYGGRTRRMSFDKSDDEDGDGEDEEVVVAPPPRPRGRPRKDAAKRPSEGPTSSAKRRRVSKQQEQQREEELEHESDIEISMVNETLGGSPAVEESAKRKRVPRRSAADTAEAAQTLPMVQEDGDHETLSTPAKRKRGGKAPRLSLSDETPLSTPRPVAEGATPGTPTLRDGLLEQLAGLKRKRGRPSKVTKAEIERLQREIAELDGSTPPEGPHDGTVVVDEGGAQSQDEPAQAIAVTNLLEGVMTPGPQSVNAADDASAAAIISVAAEPAATVNGDGEQEQEDPIVDQIEAMDSRSTERAKKRRSTARRAPLDDLPEEATRDMTPESAAARLQHLRSIRGRKSQARQEEIRRLEEQVRKERRPMSTLIASVDSPQITWDEPMVDGEPVESSNQPTQEVELEVQATTGPDDAVEENEIMAKSSEANAEQSPERTPDNETTVVKRTGRAGTTRKGGTLVAQRTKIIQDAMQSCGGVFPGNGEMWYVVVTAWQKRYRQSPDKQTVERAVRNLLATERLKKFTWTFADRKGLIHTRAILLEPHVDMHEARVKRVQREIEDAYPNQFIPPEADVFESLRHQASNVYGTPAHRQVTDVDKRPIQPVSLYRRRITFPIDERVKVQQTPASARIEDDEARRLGFEDYAAYETYRTNIAQMDMQPGLDNDGEPQFGVAQTRARDNASWRGSATSDTDDDGDVPPDQEARQSTIALKRYRHSVLPPTSFQSSRLARLNRSRQPGLNTPGMPPQRVTSLANNKNRVTPVRKYRRRRLDKKAVFPLSDGGDQWARAFSMFMSPVRAYHIPTGTFASRGFIADTSRRYTSDLRNIVYRGPIVQSVSSLRQILDGAAGLRQGSAKASRGGYEKFLEEVEAVQAWEEDIAITGSIVAGKSQASFINHSLKERHVLPTKEVARPEPHTPHDTQLPAPERMYSVDQLEGVRSGTSRRRVPIDSPSYLEKRRRDRQGAATFEDSGRLIVAIALITAVCGGINQDRLNWNLIAHALGFRYGSEFLRRRWNWLGRHRKEEVDHLRDAIREPFLLAYERDELPPLDYQNLPATDWPALLEWAESVCLPIVGSRPTVADTVDLPASRSELLQNFFLQESTVISEPKKNYYHTSIIQENRRTMLLGWQNGISLPPKLELPDGEESNMLIKSWVRAVALTKQWNYNSEAAGEKLGVFDDGSLNATLQEMTDSHDIIQDKKGRLLPGRNYQIHHEVLQQFRRWPKQDEHQFLRMVANARTSIVEHFRVADTLSLIPTAQDVEYLVLTEMVAQGFIQPAIELPERNDDPEAPYPKLTIWSYGGFNYETKTGNVNNLKFPLSYQKTDVYTDDHGLKPIPIPKEPRLFPHEPGRRIPIWMDIHDNFLEDVWDMVLRSLLHLLVYRSGATSQTFEEAHGKKMWAWEIDMVLAWAEKVGLAEHCGGGSYDHETGMWTGGWRASQWWYCAFLPEIANWTAPRGSEVGILVGFQ